MIDGREGRLVTPISNHVIDSRDMHCVACHIGIDSMIALQEEKSDG